MKLYLVISQADCGDRDFLEVAQAAIAGGVDTVQLREKDLPYEEFLHRAKALHQLTRSAGVPLIINDAVEIALEINAEGIHVGMNDEPPTRIRQRWKKCIGYSIEYLNQLESPEAAAADYLGVSPVFATSTKKDTVTVWGLEGLQKIRSLTSKPLVAIGGIGLQNAEAVLNAGADSLAVVSAICGAEDPYAAASQLKSYFQI